MKYIWLILSVAGFAVSSLHFYKSLELINNSNHFIFCCLYGILVLICFTGILMNYDVFSGIFKSRRNKLKDMLNKFYK